MILDRLEHLERYAPLHPDFPEVVRFLQETDLRALPMGPHEVRGERIYVIAAKEPARSREEAHLEAHRRYIDIQVPLSSADCIGWRSAARCRRPKGEYDAERDVQFFADRPTTWLTVEEGAFAIFFPEDAHAPLVGRGLIHKVVAKIAINIEPRPV